MPSAQWVHCINDRKKWSHDSWIAVSLRMSRACFDLIVVTVCYVNQVRQLVFMITQDCPNRFHRNNLCWHWSCIILRNELDSRNTLSQRLLFVKTTTFLSTSKGTSGECLSEFLYNRTVQVAGTTYQCMHKFDTNWKISLCRHDENQKKINHEECLFYILYCVIWK